MLDDIILERYNRSTRQTAAASPPRNHGQSHLDERREVVSQLEEEVAVPTETTPAGRISSAEGKRERVEATEPPLGVRHAPLHLLPPALLHCDVHRERCDGRSVHI